MTQNEFRKIALSFPLTTESAHMDHPDFRVHGKIFATIGYPDAAWGMVKLKPEQQEEFVRAEPTVFSPVKGGWGQKGATAVRLKSAKRSTLRNALAAAWSNHAPTARARELDPNAPAVKKAGVGMKRGPGRGRTQGSQPS
jgi:hypothetical protein